MSGFAASDGSAQRDGQLFAITFTAPRLAFFPAGVGSAESIARSARVKS